MPTGYFPFEITLCTPQQCPHYSLFSLNICTDTAMTWSPTFSSGHHTRDARLRYISMTAHASLPYLSLPTKYLVLRKIVYRILIILFEKFMNQNLCLIYKLGIYRLSTCTCKSLSPAFSLICWFTIFPEVTRSLKSECNSSTLITLFEVNFPSF